MKTVNVRVSDEVAERLDHLAAKTHRTKSFYIREIIENHLEDYEDANLALDRLNDKNARYYSTEEAEKLLEL
jgi:RHH-type rel operon transcriptional repressor/antitoxin RelB